MILKKKKMYIMNIYLSKPFYLFYKKEDIGDEKLSDNVYEQILMKKTIKSGTVTSNIDKWIIILAFIYDLNFEYSLKKIRDLAVTCVFSYLLYFIIINIFIIGHISINNFTIW